MLEFVKDLIRVLFGGRSDSYLPDCKAILFAIKSTQQLDSRSAARFVALCRITAVALAVRWICVGLLVLICVGLFRPAAARPVAPVALLLVGGVATFGTLARLARFLASDYSPGATPGGTS